MSGNELYLRIFLVLLLVYSPWILYFILDLIFPNNKKLKNFFEKFFGFILYCLRNFLLVSFVLGIVFLLPIIGLYWLILGQELFDCMNKFVVDFGIISEKKINEAKEKFAPKKLISISEITKSKL